MAAADCAMCAALGYRACDQCGTPIMDGPTGGSFGLPELCAYCR
jgi:hypothetical protein